MYVKSEGLLGDIEKLMFCIIQCKIKMGFSKALKANVLHHPVQA